MVGNVDQSFLVKNSRANLSKRTDSMDFEVSLKLPSSEVVRKAETRKSNSGGKSTRAMVDKRKKLLWMREQTVSKVDWVVYVWCGVSAY
jgi:hypothetical protein